MNWKDYFYFQKGDRIAILILFSLIIISGGIYFLSKPEQYKQAESVSKFEQDYSLFQSELTDIKPEFSPIQEKNKENNPSDIKFKYPYVTKLKEGETIDINEADTNLLKKIPGIGSTYANRIVKYKNLLGGYVSIEQLKEVWGIDNELFCKICPYIRITPKIEKLNVNTVEFKDLIKHPYINKEQARIIIDIRERKGNFESINRLALLDEFTNRDIKRLTPYLCFD